jgi:hypothetical protein
VHVIEGTKFHFDPTRLVLQPSSVHVNDHLNTRVALEHFRQRVLRFAPKERKAIMRRTEWTAS